MASVTTKIKEYVGRLVDKTTHLDAAKTTEAIAKRFGLSERLINYTHIEIRNKLNEFGYKSIPFDKRILFLPQCLRDSKNCKAKYSSEGFQCKRCGKCQINELIGMAKERDYSRVFIAPGGSMVQKLIKKYKPRAVLGVCCYDEANMAFDRLRDTNIYPQAVLLLYGGCKDTKANIAEVREKMDLIDENLLKNEES